MDLQLGDTGVGTATTTLVDTAGSTVIWDSGKTLKNRATQITSWHFSLGTKVGSGNTASGVTGTVLVFGAATTLTGIHAHYGCTFKQTAGAMQFQTATDTVGELVNCLLQSVATGVSPINIGTAAARFANVYNVDISHTTASQVGTNFGVVNAERITVAAATPTAFLSGNAAGVTAKDAVYLGSPTQSDLRWAGSSAILWRLFKPTWSGGGPKFSVASSGFPVVTSGTLEYREWNVKVVDKNGSGLANLPVRLEDATGARQVDDITDSKGEVAFYASEFRDCSTQGTTTLLINDLSRIAAGMYVTGDGIPANTIITATGASSLTMSNPATNSSFATRRFEYRPFVNAVCVMDHYAVGTTYTQRHRSPFTLKVNTRDLPGYNSLYLEREYQYNHPGYEAITTSAGQFEDVGDIIAVEDQPGLPTTWVEKSL